VWDAWQAGEIVRIRQYCETDVLNTYLIYLRFELMRGRFTPELYAQEVARVKTLLAAGTEPHFVEFLRAWETLA
jgi:3'-5' exonuclease